MIRILLTTTSFQDTPGAHHAMLEDAGYEIVRERGPLSAERMLELLGEVDGLICGDDIISRKVIEKALPRLKVISKYGIGLDKIDVAAATDLKVPVLFTPGVNHTTVAEFTFALLLAVRRNLIVEANYVSEGKWERITGRDLKGSRIGIIGMGRIGREVAIRARAFGLNVVGYGNFWDESFAEANGIERAMRLDELLADSDIISVHTMLTDKTRGLLDAKVFASMKEGAVLINCARGELVVLDDLIAALDAGKLSAYAADVLDEEPPSPDHPLIGRKDCLITPHIGSRTHESVGRQAGMTCQNLIRFFNGEKPLAQANTV
ncbi:MAG: 3-phosphoglycerate dehydrogenase [Opitutaceae bacterium]|nr:3-phosphoglycerate dehydrogenase [Opitutaceae bacterium]